MKHLRALSLAMDQKYVACLPSQSTPTVEHILNVKTFHNLSLPSGKLLVCHKLFSFLASQTEKTVVEKAWNYFLKQFHCEQQIFEPTSLRSLLFVHIASIGLYQHLERSISTGKSVGTLLKIFCDSAAELYSELTWMIILYLIQRLNHKVHRW